MRHAAIALVFFAVALTSAGASPSYAVTKPYAALPLLSDGVDVVVIEPPASGDEIVLTFKDAAFAGEVARSACLFHKYLDYAYCSDPAYSVARGCGPAFLAPPGPYGPDWLLEVRVYAVGAGDPPTACGATAGRLTAEFSYGGREAPGQGSGSP